MKYVEAKIPLFSRGQEIGVLAATISEHWVDRSILSIAIERAAIGLAAADVTLEHALATSVSADVIVEDDDGIAVPYLQIVFGIEDRDEVPTLEEANDMIDAELARRKGEPQK